MLKNRKNKEMNNDNKNINSKCVFGIGLAVGALVGGCSVFATSKILEKRANIFVEDFDFDEDYNDEDFVDEEILGNQIHESFRKYVLLLTSKSNTISVNEVLEYIEGNLEPLFEKISVDDTLRTTFNTEIQAYDEIKRRLESIENKIILDDDFNPTSIPRLLNVDLPDDPADVKKLKIRDASAKMMSGLFKFNRYSLKFNDEYIRLATQETKNFIVTIATTQYLAELK